MEKSLVVPVAIGVEWEEGTVTETLTVKEALSVVKTTVEDSGLGHYGMMTAV